MKINKIMMLVGLAIMASLTITSCKVDRLDTNPLNKKGVNLVAYGPNPVARGGYMRFMGSGMDQITSVTLAGQELTIEPVNNEEFKTLIPQDAKIGKVVLKANDGTEIVGAKEVTYTEPVGFDKDKAFEPATIKAGQTLTINGEYLNLVTKVILPEGVEVTKFKEHDRKHIVIENFPAEAQTGKVILSFVATGDTMAQEIPSPVNLNVILPSVAEIKELTEVKAAQGVVIEGKDFDLIESVINTVGDTLLFSVNEDNTLLVIFMPEVVTNCVINVFTASGIAVPVATIGVALPKVASVEDNTDVREGSEVVINGADMAIVSAINFVDINGNAITVDGDGISVTDTKVVVAVPAAAVTGAMVIKTTANIDVEDEDLTIETLKPTITRFSPEEIAMGGGTIALGANLDLVKTVTLTGGAVLTPTDVQEVAFIINIPYANAETGKVTMTMHNGETVESEVELKISAPLCAYVIEWPELVDDEPIQAGSLLRVVVGNRDKLTAVQIDGQDCAFLFNGEDVVYISTPESAGANSKVKLISDGIGEIEYDYAFKPNTEVTYVIWKGTQELAADWSGPALEIKDTRCLIDLPLEEGDDLRIWFTPTADGWTLQMNTGLWKSLNADLFGLTIPDPQWPSNINSQNADISKGYVLLKPNAVAIDTLFKSLDWGNAMIVNGASAILSKIDVVKHISLEKIVWKGNYVIDGWSNCEFGKGEGEPADLFATAGVKKGSKIRLHMNFTDGWGIKFYDGMWSGFNASDFGYTTLADDAMVINAENAPDAASKGYVELPILSDEIAKRFADMTYLTWGMAFVFQGSGLTMTSIGVE